MLFWFLENILVLYSSRFEFVSGIFFRAVMSFLSALCFFLGVGSYIIKWFYDIRFFQRIRCDYLKEHSKKQNTPTMGGIAMLFSIIISVMIWSDLSNWYVWYVLFILITYGMLGLIDDYLKIRRENVIGLRGWYKYFWQSLIALVLIITMFTYGRGIISVQLIVPFFNEIIPYLGVWYIVLAYFVIVGTSNAVNLSDGLDGLAIVPVILIAAGLSLVAWITSNVWLSNYFHLPYLCFSKELIIVCTAIIGSGLGFLWFNVYPAQIFMGDIGSLSLGSAIGVIAVLLRQECLLFIMGGVFVVEALSVILQIIYFKLFGQRIFKMAPIHHHFELKGCPESRLVVRFWIVSCILVLLGLVTLKIR